MFRVGLDAGNYLRYGKKTMTFMDCENVHETDEEGLAGLSKIIHSRIQIWYIGLTAGHKWNTDFINFLAICTDSW